MELADRRHDPRNHQPGNWSLLLALGLCVEFWILVATLIAHFS